MIKRMPTWLGPAILAALAIMVFVASPLPALANPPAPCNSNCIDSGGVHFGGGGSFTFPSTAAGASQAKEAQAAATATPTVAPTVAPTPKPATLPTSGAPLVVDLNVLASGLLGLGSMVWGLRMRKR